MAIRRAEESEPRSPVALAKGGPTVLRILLGSQLRRLRQERGISREEAGYAIRASHAKISRIELGKVATNFRDLYSLPTSQNGFNQAAETLQSRHLLRLGEEMSRRTPDNPPTPLAAPVTTTVRPVRSGRSSAVHRCFVMIARVGGVSPTVIGRAQINITRARMRITAA